MMAEQYGLIYLDYHTVLKNRENGLDKEMAEDGVHPTVQCYKIMATLAEEAIQKAMNP
jgi:lysophospholipase L1-like esterase